MTTVWRGTQPIYNLESYQFARTADDLVNYEHIEWRRAPGPSLAFYLFRDLYMDAQSMAWNAKRGDRLDVLVRSKYCDADISKASEMLFEIDARDGIQFVCYTKTGAAFIKL